jgi:hypothetical protein
MLDYSSKCIDCLYVNLPVVQFDVLNSFLSLQILMKRKSSVLEIRPLLDSASSTDRSTSNQECASFFVRGDVKDSV